MNEIRIGRLVLAALTMLLVWTAVEIFVEHFVAKLVFGQTTVEMWRETVDMTRWSASNIVINNAIAVLNCMALIWLYASLRPMYGVGTKTALITSAFGIIIFGFSLLINFINLGLIPAQVGLIEVMSVTIEFPIAMIVGAGVYEGAVRWDREVA
jgi:hypothetical protein